MLLGKRPRPPMRRTSSMTGITLDLEPQEPPRDPLVHPIPLSASNNPPADHFPASPHDHHRPFMAVATNFDPTGFSNGPYNNYDRNHLATSTVVLSPGSRNPYGAGAMETSQFLRICGLCQRRLVPGRDIYMYRGETAFCSLECREQQMKQDEKKEKKRTSAIASTSG